MSRERRVDVLRWWEDGRPKEARLVRKSASVAELRSTARRVDVCCPAGHLVAALGAGAPIVFTATDDMVSPALVLRPDGLAAAVVRPDDAGEMSVYWGGTPLASFPVWCEACGGAELALDADELRRAAPKGRSGRPARLTARRVA